MTTMSKPCFRLVIVRVMAMVCTDLVVHREDLFGGVLLRYSQRSFRAFSWQARIACSPVSTAIAAQTLGPAHQDAAEAVDEVIGVFESHQISFRYRQATKVRAYSSYSSVFAGSR